MPLIDYEISLWNKGYRLIAGVDEVGRGCLAGPLVTAAVIWAPEITTLISEDGDDWIGKINDSKKLTFKRRKELFDLIKKHVACYSITEFDNKNIDQYGVGVINKIALEKAVYKLKMEPEMVLVDHFKLFQNPIFEVKALPKGDNLSFSIASASILAKVHRDNLMIDKYHKLFPEYGFDTHVGYGTKKHIEALKEHGRCKIHRTSFKVKGVD